MRFDFVLLCTAACLGSGCNRSVDSGPLAGSDNAATTVTATSTQGGVASRNVDPAPVAVEAAKPVIDEPPAKNAGWTTSKSGDAQKVEPVPETANRIIPPQLSSSASEPPKAGKDDGKAGGREPPVELPKPSLPPLLGPAELDPAKPSDSAKPAMPLSPPDAPAKDPNAAPPQPAGPELAIEVSDKGEPALTVKFAWKEFARPSLQLALVGATKPVPLSVNGVQLTEQLGKLVSRLNKPVVAGSSVLLERAKEFSEYDDGKPLLILGATNSLGRPAAFGLGDQTGATIVFYLLDNWADANGVVRVALSDLGAVPAYAETGKLHVWFLNEEKVVWERDIAWPGKGKPQAGGAALPPQTTGEKPATDKGDSRGDAKTKTATDLKAAAENEKAAARFDPFWKAPAKSGAPTGAASPEIIAPPATESKPTESKPVEAKPAESKPAESKPAGAKPAEPAPAKTEIRDMNVEEAARYIDKTWGSGMNPKVARNWKHGMTNYFQTDNPEAVRVDVFMTLIKNCFAEQEPGELRNAFALLYQKLKQRSAPR